MQITIKGYLTLRSTIRKRVMDLEDQAHPDVGDVLNRLTQNLNGEATADLLDPATGELEGALVILLNGVHLAHLQDGIHTLVKDGDEFAIFPPLAGG
jgi:molybdopterin converting factor small subunit